MWIVVKVKHGFTGCIFGVYSLQRNVFLSTVRDSPAEKGRHYGQVPDEVESSILVPLPSRLVRAMMKFGSFHDALVEQLRCSPGARHFRLTCTNQVPSGAQFVSTAVFPYY